MNSPPNIQDYLPRLEVEYCVALDCEMVGIRNGRRDMLARVALVNYRGNCIYDKYVKPQEPVVDYRTSVSGIRPDNLATGEHFSVVVQEVKNLIHDQIVVGHGMLHDLNLLTIEHPKHLRRDTATYKPFIYLNQGNTPSLKWLARKVLNTTIQTGEHSPIEDARTAMELYLKYRNDWEGECRVQVMEEFKKRVTRWISEL